MLTQICARGIFKRTEGLVYASLFSRFTKKNQKKVKKKEITVTWQVFVHGPNLIQQNKHHHVKELLSSFHYSMWTGYLLHRLLYWLLSLKWPPFRTASTEWNLNLEPSCYRGAPWVREFGSLVVTWPYVRMTARLFALQANHCKITLSTGIATQMQLEIFLAGNCMADRVLWSRDN